MKISYILFFMNRLNHKNTELTYTIFGKNNANLDYDDHNTTVRINYYNQILKERKELMKRNKIDW